MSKKPTLINLVILFIIWYSVNCAYSVYNSKLKDDLEFPIIVAVLQLLVGLLYVIPLWLLGIRKLPKLSLSDIFTLLPIVTLNAVGHTATVIATFQKGGGSFTHVIKASEPVVSTLLTLLINGVIPTPLAGLSLLPITYGVAYASTLGNLNIATMSKELSSKAALFATISNFAFALRSIRRKNITEEFRNLADIKNIFDAIPNQNNLFLNIFICGMSYYIYNEVQNIVLGSLGPVPTAVGNTLKRVAIFVALYYFTIGETFPMPKIIGCAIAIGGCLAYAIFNTYKL